MCSCSRALLQPGVYHQAEAIRCIKASFLSPQLEQHVQFVVASLRVLGREKSDQHYQSL